MAGIDTRTDAQPSWRRRLVVSVVVALCVVVAGFLLLRARELGWTLGKIYAGLFALHCMICAACLVVWNPVLLARRMYIGSGTKSWDKVWLVVFSAIVVAVVVVAVRDLDTRAGQPSSPGIGWLIGLAIFVPGWMLITWAMVANPFFEKTVRIQTDHGHRVIDGGPYGYIRHPGYVGISAVFLATPLLLASAWTLLPSLIAVVALVIRTVLEDRTLRAELPGYREYAARVRFRLVPGVW